MKPTRQALLAHLLQAKDGLTTDEIAQQLQISRTAVQQHLVGLERDRLVRVVEQRKTGGRPSRVYVLSEKGYETFPRRYALLADRTLRAAAELLGEEGVDRLFDRVADDLATELEPRLAGLSGPKRLAAVVEVMNELGYEASAPEDGTRIRAVNCIYHHLARQTRAVCRFDVQLLSRLIGRELDHQSCMVDGENACVFAVRENGERE